MGLITIKDKVCTVKITKYNGQFANNKLHKKLVAYDRHGIFLGTLTILLPSVRLSSENHVFINDRHKKNGLYDKLVSAMVIDPTSRMMMGYPEGKLTKQFLENQNI